MARYLHLCDILLVYIMNIFTSWSWKLQILLLYYLKYALLTVNDQCSYETDELRNAPQVQAISRILCSFLQ